MTCSILSDSIRSHLFPFIAVARTVFNLGSRHSSQVESADSSLRWIRSVLSVRNCNHSLGPGCSINLFTHNGPLIGTQSVPSLRIVFWTGSAGRGAEHTALVRCPLSVNNVNGTDRFAQRPGSVNRLTCRRVTDRGAERSVSVNRS